jgi:hypothetical protein
MNQHSFIVTYELYLRVLKVWEVRKVLTNEDGLACVEASFKIMRDYGDARNLRIIESNVVSVRIGGDVPASVCNLPESDGRSISDAGRATGQAK